MITPNVSEEEMYEVLLADLQQLQGLDGQGVIQMMQNKVREEEDKSTCDNGTVNPFYNVSV